ncbi:MAG: hypothetical protein LW838_02190, partial [Nitrosomonadaceae bacterium]|nr:hypothetical protein [Nitrosomonadaceae bacterium]
RVGFFAQFLNHSCSYFSHAHFLDSLTAIAVTPVQRAGAMRSPLVCVHYLVKRTQSARFA